MSKYGPGDSYPKEILCESCNKKIFIQWSSKTLKEYVTENKAWQQGTNGATFHKCPNWKRKTKPVVVEEVIKEEKTKKTPLWCPLLTIAFSGHMKHCVEEDCALYIRGYCGLIKNAYKSD